MNFVQRLFLFLSVSSVTHARLDDLPCQGCPLGSDLESELLPSKTSLTTRLVGISPTVHSKANDPSVPSKAAQSAAPDTTVETTVENTTVVSDATDDIVTKRRQRRETVTHTSLASTASTGTSRLTVSPTVRNLGKATMRVQRKRPLTRSKERSRHVKNLGKTRTAGLFGQAQAESPFANDANYWEEPDLPSSLTPDAVPFSDTLDKSIAMLEQNPSTNTGTDELLDRLKVLRDQIKKGDNSLAGQIHTLSSYVEAAYGIIGSGILLAILPKRFRIWLLLTLANGFSLLRMSALSQHLRRMTSTDYEMVNLQGNTTRSQSTETGMTTAADERCDDDDPTTQEREPLPSAQDVGIYDPADDEAG